MKGGRAGALAQARKKNKNDGVRASQEGVK